MRIDQCLLFVGRSTDPGVTSNVNFKSMEILEEAMNTIKTNGFINYYG